MAINHDPKEPHVESLHLAEKIKWSLNELQERFPQNTLSEIETELHTATFAPLFDLAEQTGAQVYLTGGIVRDALLNQKPKDYDFIVNFPNMDSHKKARAAFESFFGKEVETSQGEKKIRGPYGTLILSGENFGVYKLYPKNMKDSDEPIDIAFPRREVAYEESLGGAKDFDMQSDATLPVETDLTRRDFTINALALKIDRQTDGTITMSCEDHIKGLDDIEAGVIRAVGDPRERINEDNSRALRALRFEQQKGLTMTPDLEDVIKTLNSTRDNVPILKRTRADGRFVTPKTTVAKEFLKAFYASPHTTLKRADELGFLPDLMPALITYEPLAKARPPRELRERADLLSEKTPDNDPFYNVALREHAYTHAKKSLEFHFRTYSDATVDEYFFLLTYELGKSHHFARKDRNGNEHFDPQYLLMSEAYMREIVKYNNLESMQEGHHLKIHPSRIAAMMERYYSAISLLSLDHSKKLAVTEMTPKFIENIRNTFPELTHDPLWRTLQSSIRTSETADKGINELIRLEQQLIAVEQLLHNSPDRQSEVINGGDIATHFYFEQSRDIATANIKFDRLYLRIISRDKFQSNQELKRKIFAKIMGRESPVREHWRKRLISPKDIDLIRDHYETPELATRSLLRAVERTSCKSYLGETLDEAAENEPSIANEINRRSKILPFMEAFVRTLTHNPKETLKWLEEGFNNDKKGRIKQREVASVIFPELLALNGCEHDPTYHSEGDTWTHTALLFEKAEEQGFELTPELALAILYHDSGKPPTQTHDGERIHFYDHESKSAQIMSQVFDKLGIDKETSTIDTDAVLYAISHHGTYYNHPDTPPSLLEIRRLMPEGTASLLYKLIVCDSLASIPEDPEKSNVPFVKHLSAQARRISLEAHMPTLFDELSEHPFITDFIGKDGHNEKYTALYQLYIEDLENKYNETDSSDDIINRIIKKIIRTDKRWTRNYVGRIVLSGRRCLEHGIRGKEIGILQEEITNRLYDGQEVTDQDVDSLITNHIARKIGL